MIHISSLKYVEKLKQELNKSQDHAQEYICKNLVEIIQEIITLNVDDHQLQKIASNNKWKPIQRALQLVRKNFIPNHQDKNEFSFQMPLKNQQNTQQSLNSYQNSLLQYYLIDKQTRQVINPQKYKYIISQIINKPNQCHNWKIDAKLFIMLLLSSPYSNLLNKMDLTPSKILYKLNTDAYGYEVHFKDDVRNLQKSIEEKFGNSRLGLQINQVYFNCLFWRTSNSIISTNTE